MLAPKVVLLMDGGVCSQMHQYLLGHLFGQNGYRVEYDLTFFKEWGSDMDYHFVRTFDLQKAFPYLSVKKASKVAVDVYKLSLIHIYLEIILIDDGSSDGSGELCDLFAQRDGRIKVIHQTNACLLSTSRCV